jgi:hypothetical protein
MYEQIRDLLDRGILNESDISLNYYDEENVRRANAARLSDMYEGCLSKEDMMRQNDRLMDRIDTLQEKNSQYLERISEHEELIDSLGSKLRASEDELQKIKAVLGNQSFEGLREAIYILYHDDSEKANAIVIKVTDFMNYGTLQALEDIPNQYYLQEAVIRLRYRYVIKNLSTTIR